MKTKLNPNDFFPEKVVELIYAVDAGDTSIASSLVKSGVDVNFEGKDGATPLLWILSQSQKPNGIKELILLGANPNRISQNGYSPVYFSAGMCIPNTTEILELLLKNGGDPNISNPVKKTPAIIHALDSLHNEKIKILKQYGANINVVDGSGDSLLVNAAMLNQHDLITYLLEQGVVITDKDKQFLVWHFKHLHIAKEYQHEADTAKQLLMDRGVHFE